MKFFAAAITLVAAAVANAQVNFTDCLPSLPLDLNITSITLDPYPMCPGKNVCATIVGTLSAPIISPSSLYTIAMYFGMTMVYEVFDLCTLMSCPVAQNTTTLEFCFPMKPNIPSGWPLNFTFSAVNGNGDQLFCKNGMTTFNCSS